MEQGALLRHLPYPYPNPCSWGFILKSCRCVREAATAFDVSLLGVFLHCLGSISELENMPKGNSKTEMETEKIVLKN